MGLSLRRGGIRISRRGPRTEMDRDALLFRRFVAVMKRVVLKRDLLLTLSTAVSLLRGVTVVSVHKIVAGFDAGTAA